MIRHLMSMLLAVFVGLFIISPAPVMAHPHGTDQVTQKVGDELGFALGDGEGTVGEIASGVGGNFDLGGGDMLGSLGQSLGGGGDMLGGLGDSLGGVTGGLDGQLGGLGGVTGGLDGQLGGLGDSLSGLGGMDQIGGLDQLGSVSKLGEISSLKGMDGLQGLQNLQGLQGLSGNFTNKLGSWGLDSTGFKAFQSQMNSFGNVVKKAKKGTKLSGTKRAIMGFLNAGSAPFKKFRNVRAGYKNMAETYDELKNATQAFSNMDLKSAATSKAMKDAFPSSITNQADRAATMVEEFKNAQQRIGGLPDRAEQKKEQLKAAATKFFLKPGSTDGERKCRDLTDVQDDLSGVTDKLTSNVEQRTQDAAGGVSGDISADVDVTSKISSALSSNDFLSKARSLCEGKEVAGVQLSVDEAVESAKEKAESFKAFQETVTDAMYRQYGEVGTDMAVGTVEEEMQFQRNSEIALSQKVREIFLNAEQGAYSGNALKRSAQASKRGVRQNMQGMVYAQMMRMQQGGLELMLLTSRLRQIAREASKPESAQ